LIASLAKPIFRSGHLPDDPTDIAFHFCWITIALIAAITKREWVHKFFSLVSALAFVVYIGLLFTRLR
jgi:hypothetical protein